MPLQTQSVYMLSTRAALPVYRKNVVLRRSYGQVTLPNNHSVAGRFPGNGNGQSPMCTLLNFCSHL